MDPSSQPANGESDEHISVLLNEFFDRRSAGEELLPERFLAEHPDAAEQLRPHLEALPLIDLACTPAIGGREPAGQTDDAELPEIDGFELIGEIGRGGMGVVYQALQLSTKRIVALKVMLSGPFSSPTGRRRFVREVELAARLQHPHIVRVLESGRAARQLFYAMDFVDGIPLDRYLANAQPDHRAILAIFRRVAKAIEYAHEQGVIHRDLKPSNVLIDAQGEPHILDFGLAKAVDQGESAVAVSQPGQVLGTLFYLSPEQAAGDPTEIDHRTDVYALGVMLFEALTGRLPLDTRGRPSEIIQRILEVAPPRPSSLSTRVDGELETIVLKALQKEKSRRYQSAADLQEDLRRYLAGEPILARRPSSLYLLRKKLRKHRWAATLAALTLIVLAAAQIGRTQWKQQRITQARRDALGYQQALEAGDTEAAFRFAESAHARPPFLPEERLLLAHARYRYDKAPEAGIQILERSLENQVPWSWAYSALLADIYTEVGDQERANQLRTLPQQDAPDTAEAWYLRSFATLFPEPALKYAEQAVRVESDHLLAWNRVAWLRRRTGDLEGALRGADRLIELGEDPASWIIFKGQVRARQGRFRQAIEEFTRALAFKPERSEAYIYRAHAYRRLGANAQAVADYSRRLEAGSERTANVWDYYQRATPLWMLGRTEEAVRDCERVRFLLARPSYADARRYLMLLELNRTAEAREVLDAARRDAAAPSWLRDVFRCLAREITPEQLVEAAGENDEYRCEALYYAGEVALLSGALPRAREWFTQCVETGVEFDPDTGLLTPMNEFELAQWRLKTLPQPTLDP